MINGLIHQKDKTIINRYIPSNRSSKYMTMKKHVKTVRIERKITITKDNNNR